MSTQWCFTMINYEQKDIDRLKERKEHIGYMIYGRDRSRIGTPRLTGIVCFKEKKTLQEAMTNIGRARLQSYFKAANLLRNYITLCKEDNDYIEWGEIPNIEPNLPPHE